MTTEIFTVGYALCSSVYVGQLQLGNGSVERRQHSFTESRVKVPILDAEQTEPVRKHTE
jgi:hypothetical protein